MQAPAVFRAVRLLLPRLLTSPRRLVCATVGLLFAVSSAKAQLPAGWAQADVGCPALAGSASYSNNNWVVTGGGGELCGSDQYHFAWTPLNGDGALVARVASMEGGSFLAKAGILIRADTQAGTAQVALVAQTNHILRFQWRTAAGGDCGSQGLPNPGGFLWMRLQRTGDQFIASYSADRSSWTNLGAPQIVPMGQRVLAGLVVCADDNGSLCTASFSELQFEEPTFGAYRELWSELSPAAGDSLAALTNVTLNPNWPDRPEPTYTGILPSFETERDSGLQYYGQRLRAFIIPPRTGEYRFGIASDNTSELRVSTDEFPANGARICWVTNATGYRQWAAEPNQVSSPILLQAGQRYFLEALMQQSTGPDHLSVRAVLPDGSVDEPLGAAGANGVTLIPFTGRETIPGIATQPVGVTVPEGSSAAFQLLVTNTAPVHYFWLRDGSWLGTSAPNAGTLVISNAWAPLDGSLYACVVSNAAGAVTSAPAKLNVILDQTPPTVLAVTYLNPTNVQILFSEPLDRNAAVNLANYQASATLNLVGAELSENATLVTLRTEPMLSGSNYVLVLNGITDLAYHPNVIAPNTTIRFLASLFTPTTIGNSTPAGTVTVLPDGFEVAGGGKDFGANTDQCQFAHRQRTGDFDLKVNLRSLSQTDAYAKAGLMVREELSENSRFAAVISTPSIAGTFFSSRMAPGAKAGNSRSYPVNYPDTWLRLRRVGSEFSGYYSFDGSVWQAMGSVSINMSNTVFVGVFCSSHDPAQLAVARFGEITEVLAPAEGSLQINQEPPEPSSRRTGLALTEIMYHPEAATNGSEFVEIMNTQPFFEDISGYSLSGDIAFTFPPNTVLASGAYLVIAAEPAAIRQRYGITNVAGPYAGNLPNDAGVIRLCDRSGAVLLETAYESQAPWSAAADGAGHSLVLARPSYGENDPRAWTASRRKGGSPGGPDPVRGLGTEAVVVNEILANTSAPDLDAVELFNRTAAAIDLSGCFLSDSASTNKFRIPDGTRIQARGLLSFDEATLGFRLNASGEAVYLVSADDTEVLDCVRFGGQEPGRSFGRFPDGEGPLRKLGMASLGQPNSSPALGDVVINEILYNGPSGDPRNEFIELFNRSTNTVDLTGWRITSGVGFAFPTFRLLPGAFVVVARDAGFLRANYPNLGPANLVGDFTGGLSGKGERVTLSKPSDSVATNAFGDLVTNRVYTIESEVTYDSGGRWGTWADGGGSSLELINPDAEARLAPNWADSDESTKAPWTTIETTGVLDLGGGYSADQLQLFLEGPGECLVDNVEVFKTNEANRVTNPNFSNGASGWFFQGTQRATTVDASGGFGGGPCLHVRASGRGDTGANRIRTVLTSPLSAGDVVTIRAKVRWLRGNHELLMRLHGNWLEAFGILEVPKNPGTPGERNSRFTANPGPAITDVCHFPILPAANEAVRITARVAHPANVGEVVLHYRNDTQGTAVQDIAMTDDGMAADRFAGDGIYSAWLPGLPPRSIAAFYVEASAAAGAGRATFPNDAPDRECLVGFGETLQPGTFGNYRTWVTKKNVSYWSTREKNSNDPLDATFVYGDSRVVYNMKTYYSGSPFHTSGYSSPTGSACDYILSFPEDDPLLGANDFVIATLGNLNNDDTAQREQAAFWLLRELGVPSLYRRYVFMFVNGQRRGTVLEDTQQPSSDLVAQYFPEDRDGNLHKIEDWFEFDNSGSGFVNTDATLDNFLTTGGIKKTARYRWTFRPRAVKRSHNEFEPLFSLVDVLHTSTPEPYNTQVAGMVDVEEWMRVLAVERFVGNWDSFAYQRGKNMYAYKPLHGKWSLLPWDIDFVLGLGDGATTSLFGGQDSSVESMRNNPRFLRAYWRAFQDLLDGPAQVSRIGAMLTAKQQALVANSVAASSPASIQNFVNSRRSYIQPMLNRLAVPFSVAATKINNNQATISGTAPIAAVAIWFNGAEYPISWTSVTNWTAAVPLSVGTNLFAITGVDRDGQQVPRATNSVALVYSGNVPSPAGQVVINELMYAPTSPAAQFVELYNTSATASFDLSRWRLQGVDYTFPSGSILRPSQYLVLAQDRAAFAQEYGANVPVFDVYPGTLQRDGETLSLFSSTANGESESLVTRVRYGNQAPWPDVANGSGASLQLIDARRDNWRVGNWGAVGTNTAVQQWRYFTVTGTASSSKFYIYLRSAGEVFLDDIQLVKGAVPEGGINVLKNGDFESALAGSWTVSANLAGSTLTANPRHGGNSSLHLVSTSAGSSESTSIFQNISPALSSGEQYTLSFWYLPGATSATLIQRLSGSGVSATVSLSPSSSRPIQCTPAAVNTVAANLPDFPALWINEVQAENVAGPTNQAGARTPWFELFNPTTNSVSLAGIYASTNYANPTNWAFPASATLGPGHFMIVFADGQPGLSRSNELHAGFALPPGSGSLLLSRIQNGSPQVLDYVDYTNLLPGRSYGATPDGQSFTRQEFIYVTPGGTNDTRWTPANVFINEWMADNSSGINNPVDLAFSDWFELYNAGTNAVDLGGYFLSDQPGFPKQFEIPRDGRYVISPKSFLLVWADGEPTRNTNSPDLHANFKLSREGEFLGLFAPDGSPVDLIQFGPQFTDVSAGRYPDGAPQIAQFIKPSPRAPNVLSNTPPVVSPIPHVFAYVGQNLRFSIPASDRESAAEALSFSLAPGAPPEASLDGHSGLFQWSAATNPGTNRVTVVVLDDGSPPLSCEASFLVIVQGCPNVSGLVIQADQVQFNMQTAPGQKYQLEYSNDLTPGSWAAAGGIFNGTGEMLTGQLELSTDRNVFYRIRVMPWNSP